MNILLSNHCNRRCPYCFAKERVSYTRTEAGPHRAPMFIAEDDFRTAVAFAKKSNIDHVGLLGGEPSLHPRFSSLLAIAISEEVHPKVFTNGLWEEDTILAVEAMDDRSKNDFGFVVNVNEPDRISTDEQRRQRRLLSRLGHRCSLSFNISHADFNPDFLSELIDRYETARHIRLGVAQPLAQTNNEHIDISDYRSMVPSIMRLAELADEQHIRLGFDCGFILCMFEEKEIGRLITAGARFRAACGPAIDIGTDLSVWACFPLSTFATGERLSEFADVKALVAHFEKQFEPLFKTGALAECVGCRHRKRGQCTGGCAAHVYRKAGPP